MNLRSVLKSQYHASLKTLWHAIDRCPETMWNDPQDGVATFWRVAYHTLYYTHIYLMQDEHAFVPRDGDREVARYLDLYEGTDHDAIRACPPYSREQILEYWAYCDALVDTSLDTLDLEVADSGFRWYPKMTKLEHQLINLRHIQHHAAALGARLRRATGESLPWVGVGGSGA